MPAEVRGRTKQPYRAPIGEALAGPSAPGYVRELLSPGHVRAAGLLDPAAVDRLVRKFAATGGVGVGETDEMAFVASLTLMLLHEHFVAAPRLAPALVPDRFVVGDTLQAFGEANVAEAR